ncbi:MAG: redoxin domain-containing protein [Cruoricaptor ignavus]|nr:redoxin domain-containing protein [Cruoricaptor ignavus]
MKNKKTLKILAFAFPLLLLGIIGYLFFGLQQKKQMAETLHTLPEISMKTINGKGLQTKKLDNGKNKVIIYFSPHCHFCEAEAEELSKIYAKNPDTEWIWIASEPIEEIKDFAKQHQLDNKEQIKWCNDDQALFYRKFSLGSVPYLLAYNKNNQLVYKNKGAIKLEQILTHF